MLFNVTAYLEWPTDWDNALLMSLPSCISTRAVKTYVEAPNAKTAAKRWLARLTSEEQAAATLVIAYRTPRKVAEGYLGRDRNFRPKLNWIEPTEDRYDAVADLDRMGGTWKES